MSVTNPEELFLHEMSDQLSCEQLLVGVLGTMAGEVDDEEFRSALQKHQQQTQEHVQRLERAFQILGKQPEKTLCYGAQGLKQEHDTFASQESPTKQILTMFDTGAGEKTEHYEITAYKGLIEKAQLMGHGELVSLFQQSLGDEEWMAQTTHQIAGRLARQALAGTAV
jgi:ferritin-like metal-binding protein YciE